MHGEIGPDVEYGPPTPRVPKEERPPVGPDVEYGAPRTEPAEPDLTASSGGPDLAADDGAVAHDAGQADVLEQTGPQ